MTMMLGGVICGYWATGRLQAATAPARVITIDSTEAKIGRSMKKCENMPGLKIHRGERREHRIMENRIIRKDDKPEPILFSVFMILFFMILCSSPIARRQQLPQG